jgi:hypothetical protein
MRDERLTALDGIALFLTGLLASVLFAFPYVVGPSFRVMFDEFCRKDALPPLTNLALSVWFPSVLGAVTASGPAFCGISSISLAYRRGVLVAAFVFGCAALAVCLVGMYLPIFELAGKIKE